MLNKKKLLIIATMVYATVLSAQKPADAKKAVEPAKTTTATELPKGDAKAVTAVNAEFKPLGFLGFAYAEGTYAITCGGPKLGFTYGAFGMAAGFYPSLVYADSNRVGATLSGAPGVLTDPVRPALGAGVEISYGKIALIAPVYYLGGTNRSAYYYTIGIGYKF